MGQQVLEIGVMASLAGNRRGATLSRPFLFAPSMKCPVRGCMLRLAGCRGPRDILQRHAKQHGCARESENVYERVMNNIFRQEIE